MLKLKNALQAVGIVLGSWLALFLTGYIAGVLPGIAGPFGQLVSAEGVTNSKEKETKEKETKEKPNTSQKENSEKVPAQDATKKAAAEAPEAQAKTLASRFYVCANFRALVAADIFGDEHEELAASCGAELQVLSGASDGERPPQLIATYKRAEATENEVASAIAVGDMTGDSHKDLAVAFRELDAAGHAKSGVVYLVPGSETGAVGTPILLGSAATSLGISADVIGSPVADLIIATEGKQAGRFAYELWVFEGGASPQRKARLAVEEKVIGLVSADIDANGHMDVLAACSNGEVRVYYGDGKGFSKSESVNLPGLNHLMVMPTGKDNLLTAVASANQGLFVVKKGSASVLSAARLVESDKPASVSAFHDVTGNGHMDAIGRSSQGDETRLNVYEATDGKYEERPWLVLSGATVSDFYVGSYDDAIGADVYALANLSSDDGARVSELLFFGMPPAHREGDAQRVGVNKEAIEIDQAPLMLNILLR